MKKIVAVAAATLIAPALVTATAAPAMAKPAPAPSDPVSAIKQQFVKKSGVRIVDSLRLTVGKDVLLRGESTGLLRFGPAGVNAFDLKTSTKFLTNTNARTIASGKNLYVQNKDIQRTLPEGKTWVRVPSTPADIRTLSSIGLVNMTDLKVLRSVLATTRSKVDGGKVNGAKTVVYRGTITLQQLAKVSQTARAAVKDLKSKKPLVVSWKLWVAGDRLPRRFTTSILLDTHRKLGDAVLSSDLRLTGWGARTPVKTPPASQVIDAKDLESGDELAEDLAGQTLVPLGDPYEGKVPTAN